MESGMILVVKSLGGIGAQEPADKEGCQWNSREGERAENDPAWGWASGKRRERVGEGEHRCARAPRTRHSKADPEGVGLARGVGLPEKAGLRALEGQDRPESTADEVAAEQPQAVGVEDGEAAESRGCEPGGERGGGRGQTPEGPRVSPEPVRDTGEGRLEKRVRGVRTDCCGLQGEVLEVVPGGGRDPRVLRLADLGPDEASWVGDAEGSDGADVVEQGVVNSPRDETMSQVLVEGSGGREGDGVRNPEGDGVLNEEDGGAASLDEKRVHGAEGVEQSDGKELMARREARGLEPLECPTRLGVVGGWVSFGLIHEVIALETKAIKFGMERKVGEGRLGRDDEGGVQLLELGALVEEIGDLSGRVVHESVVHENGFTVGEVSGCGGIPGSILRDESVVDKVGEVGLPRLELGELLWLNEHDIGGTSGIVGPDVHEEMGFDGLVDRVRVGGMAKARDVNAAGMKEGVELLGDGPRVSLKRSSERGGE